MNPDVLIYGAGVIGCSIAREVSACGLSVLVVERGRPGGEASGAAAGLLTPQSHAVTPGPLVELAIESLRLYPTLADELRVETGIDVELSRCGSVRLSAPDGTEDGEIRQLLDWQTRAGLRAERVGAERLARLSRRRLAPAFCGGVEFPDEATVGARPLVEALWKSAERRGARFLLGESVESVRVSHGRCVGVVTRGGRIDAGSVVDAAGSWSGPPIRPIRGQIVELASADTIPSCPLLLGDFYLVPRPRGRILLGSTQEDAGFEKKVTAAAVRDLLGRAIELVPSLASAEVAATWSGLRPASPDGLPVLGETSVEGLLAATGHFRNGVLLAPITARILAAVISSRVLPVSIEAFRAERYAFTPQNES